MDGVKRTGIEVLAYKGVTIAKLRNIWANIPYYEQSIDKQVETDAHYASYLKRQIMDIEAFKKDAARHGIPALITILLAVYQMRSSLS